MLNKPKSESYRVKLQKELPSSQASAFMLARSLETTYKLSGELVTACTSRVRSELAPWQQVQKMQVISTVHLARSFAQKKGVSADRFFDKDCLLRGGKFKDRGHVKKKLKGGSPLLARTLALIQRRLDELYTAEDAGKSESYRCKDGGPPRVDVNYRQALWRSLLIECPIADVAEELYCVHEEGGIDPFMLMRNGLLAGDQWSLSMCLTPGLAGWEYLAGCVTLLREYSERRNFDPTQRVARNICLLLTLMGVEFQDHGIGSLMLAYCCTHILPLGRIEVDLVCVARASALLNTLVLASFQSEELEVDWGVRRYLMAGILLNNIDPDLLAICDPTKYANGYPNPNAWERVRGRTIKIKEHAYPPMCGVLDLDCLLAKQPQINAWVAPIALEPSDPKVQAPRDLWDGLGSRNVWSKAGTQKQISDGKTMVNASHMWRTGG